MSMRLGGSAEVPEETVRIARLAFPNGSLAIRIRDELGTLYSDEQFAELFSTRGKPACSPGRLALTLVLQFVEGLSDRQAAEAVRARIDWKYALGMELTDPGFDYSVLSEFRDRLLTGGAEKSVLETLLAKAKDIGLLKPGGRQRTDATHVLASVREMNRLESIGETMRATLNTLAATAPQWLSAVTQPAWFKRYSSRVEDYRLPKGAPARIEMAKTIGEDGMELLRAVYAPQAPLWLREVPAVQVLRQVWVQQYEVTDGVLSWRKPKEGPPAGLRLVSPYDLDCRTGVKRDTMWDGYKIHLTETCEPDAPHLVTHVITTDATGKDFDTIPEIHNDLDSKGLLPGVHLVDTGYITARHVVAAQQTHQVELLGPTMPYVGWQTRSSESFQVSDFSIDWNSRRVTCPAGKTSIAWCKGPHKHKEEIRAEFSPRDCSACPLKEKCTRGTRRRLTLRPEAEYRLLQSRRSEEQTAAWQARYQVRSGIEGTISQGVGRCGLRRSRYRGTAKTHLQHVLTATAMNLVRLDSWLTSSPTAPTRTSAFAALGPAE
ncbi:MULTISPECIES: IS1182 family transposase [unclassified Streptomyces]|uniref:IS1182 family transposase n=1 Tax=unclassified Streptomyces TaxID=2593676 RepID=UPI00344396E0